MRACECPVYIQMLTAFVWNTMQLATCKSQALLIHSSSVAGVVDDEVVGGWVNYSTGPVSVGYRLTDNSAGAGTEKNVEAYAIAFNVNDNMSVSLATQDIEFDRTAGGTNTTETIDAINAAYTMGAASVRATMSEASDDAGVAGSDDEHMEISLVLSF